VIIMREDRKEMRINKVSYTFAHLLQVEKGPVQPYLHQKLVMVMPPQAQAPSPFRQNSIRNLLNNKDQQRDAFYGIAMTPQNFNLAPTPINMQLHEHMTAIMPKRQGESRKQSGKDQELLPQSMLDYLPNLTGLNANQPQFQSLAMTPQNQFAVDRLSPKVAIDKNFNTRGRQSHGPSESHVMGEADIEKVKSNLIGNIKSS
jgi:hypothetical protein